MPRYADKDTILESIDGLTFLHEDKRAYTRVTEVIAAAKEQSAAQIIAEACEDICDNYCRFTDLYNKLGEVDGLSEDEIMDKMIQERCNYCPLNRIL